MARYTIMHAASTTALDCPEAAVKNLRYTYGIIYHFSPPLFKVTRVSIQYFLLQKLPYGFHDFFYTQILNNICCMAESCYLSYTFRFCTGVIIRKSAKDLNNK